MEDLAKWMTEMGEWTISRRLESGEWTPEEVVIDWTITGSRLAYLSVFAENAHLLTVEDLHQEPDGDGWKVRASGQDFSIGLVWSDQQWADLERWKTERPPVVGDALAQLIA